MPAFNSENTISESIMSIVDGNFQSGDEIIIVNDRSSDRTESIVQELIKKLKLDIKIINNKENIGCPASRNVGIGLSKNDYIFNLDSDNILAPESIMILKKYLIENCADIVAFEQYLYFKNDKNEITHKWLCNPGQFKLNDLFSGNFNPAPGGNFLFTKKIWSSVGGYWEYGKGLHEAWGFSFKLLVNGATFFVVPNTFYYHRYSHDSLFVRESKNNNESIIVTNKFIANYKEIFTETSLNYILNDSNWFNKLDNRPIGLKVGGIGKNGSMVYCNKIKNLLHRLITFIKKYEKNY